MINLKTKNYVKPILFIVSILTLAGCRQISVSNINNDYVIDQDSGKAVDIKQILDLKGKFDNEEAGETITIPAGIYEGNFVLRNSGTRENPIRITAKSGETVTLALPSNGAGAILELDHVHDIQLLDNEISECMIGIEVGAEQKAPEYPAQNILVRGNTMRNNPYGGLWVGGYSDDAGFVTDVIVTRNTFQKNGTVEDGFYGEIYQTNVTNLKLSDNTFQ